MNTTDFLVAKNGFISGMGRVLDLGSTRNKYKYNSSKSGRVADSRALRSDWIVIGNDIKGAYNDVKSKQKTATIR